jgi:hypothetical protein
MVALLRRFLVLMALMFWQGGFLFYASVVVPIGQAQLTHLRQGFITREVTDYLNLAGAVALLPLAWDLAVSPDRSARRAARWGLWLSLALTVAVLAWLHLRLDDLLDLENRLIDDRGAFRTLHRVYLWTSTVQWAFGLVYLWLTLCGWRLEDRSEKVCELTYTK